jgi:hypothetical protein
LNAACSAQYCQWVKDYGPWTDIELGAARTLPVDATAAAATNTDDSVALSTVMRTTIRKEPTIRDIHLL